MNEKDRTIITFGEDTETPDITSVSSSGNGYVNTDPGTTFTLVDPPFTAAEPSSTPAEPVFKTAEPVFTPAEPASTSTDTAFTPAPDSNDVQPSLGLDDYSPDDVPEFDYTTYEPYSSESYTNDSYSRYDNIETSYDQETASPSGYTDSGHTDSQFAGYGESEAIEEAADVSAIPADPYGSNNTGKKSGRNKKKKEPKYVTKGFLIVCMIITIIISSSIGAVVGGKFTQNTSSDGRAERNDSELSSLNLSDATGSELTVSQIVAKNADAVVEIVVEGTTQGMWGQLQLTQGAGSGVIVREDGYIATNYHVIDGANKVEVTLHNGNTYEAKIIGSDASNDIAVIKIDEKDLTAAEIGDSSKVAVGELAVAIGNPLGQLGGTATEGIISALDRTLTIEGTTLTLLQTDAAINGGNSGGGLFNSKGELIGIVESKASAVGVEGLAFALPINNVSGIINDFIENGGSTSQSSGTPAIGIVISDVSEQNAQYYNLEAAGVYIAQITGSNAKKAGFQEGDRIVSFNGKDITDGEQFISLVRKQKVGDTVTVVVSREGQMIEIKTELEALQTNN